MKKAAARTTLLGLFLAASVLAGGWGVFRATARLETARGQLLLTFAKTQWVNHHYLRALDLGWLAVNTAVRESSRQALLALYWQRALALRRSGQVGPALTACHAAAQFAEARDFLCQCAFMAQLASL